MRPMQLQLDALRQRLRALDRVVVAFSGGADSAFLAWVAHHTLGPDRSLAVTAVSPSLPGAERADCAQLAAEWGLRWREVETDEMADAAYARNDGDRCYWCKDALLRAVVVAAPRPAHVGQAGRRLPGLAAALRHAGHVAAAGDRRAGRSRPARARVRRGASAALRRHRTARGAGRAARRRGGRARSGGGHRPRRRLPLRDARPRGPALRQPQRRPRARRERLMETDHSVGRRAGAGAQPGTGVQVGNVRCSAPRWSAMRPLAANWSRQRRAVCTSPTMAT